MKILHLCRSEKFTPPFIEFMRKNFNCGQHKFLIFEDYEKFPYTIGEDTTHVKNFAKQFFPISKELYQADKIILHSYTRHFLIFFIQPWLWSKAYWVIWGGDLYNNISPKRGIKALLEWHLSKKVVRSLKGIICFIKGDYDLAVKCYGTKSPFFECVMYRGNVDFFDSSESNKSTEEPKIIQVGNSASSFNEHTYALDKLAPFKDENIKILCPLSYHHDAGEQYAKNVAAYGKKLFGEKFVPITDYMPLEEYLKLLASVDIGVFTHRRQQGLGNSITLLGSGKKVYMHSNVAQWDFFRKMGVIVYDIDNFSLDPTDDEEAQRNSTLIRNYFSEENVLKQMRKIYDS